MKKSPTKFIRAKTVEYKHHQPSTLAKSASFAKVSTKAESSDKPHLAEAPQGIQKSPSISRKIPEITLGSWVRLATLKAHWDVIFVSFMCGILLMGISVMGFRLKERFVELQRREEIQAKLEDRKRYWEEVVKKYSDYKDAYYQLAIYSYELGFKGEAQRAIDKVLEIDPNDINGLELAKKISG